MGSAAVIEIGSGGMCSVRGCSLESASSHLLVIDPRKCDDLRWTWFNQEDSPDYCMRTSDAPGVLVNMASLQHSQLFDPARTTVFLLLPSTTSSPEALLHAEVGLQNMFAGFLTRFTDLHAEMASPGTSEFGLPPDWLRIIRTDDWACHGAVRSPSEHPCTSQSTGGSWRWVWGYFCDCRHVVSGDGILIAMLEQGKLVYPAEEAQATLGMGCTGHPGHGVHTLDIGCTLTL